MSYFEHNIYIQTAYQGVRNKDILNVNTSSDICVFESPSFSMTGASNLVCSATTGTSHIHMVTAAKSQDFTFDFAGDTGSFDKDTSFKFDIYKYNTELGLFSLPTQYTSTWYEWESFSATSAVTVTIPYTSLDIDGDYLFKGSFQHNVCTEFAKRLDITNDTSLIKTGEEFGLFQPNSDYFMSIVRVADTPIFGFSGGDTTELRTLRQISVIPTSGQTVFILNSDVAGDFVVTLNGLTLARDLDYSVSFFSAGTQPIVITLFDEAKDTDILTYIYTSQDEGNGLKIDEFDVTSIPSGPTDGEGSSNVYLNTTTGKYELFTTLTPTSEDSIIVTINGVTLALGVDYYQSTSNPNRIILEGTVLIDDVITIIYNQGAQFVEEIGIPTPQIQWSIVNQPTTTNGRFILEFANDEAMTSQVSSAQTQYVINQSVYNATATLTGSVGTQLYYRVQNIKDYTNLCGELIQTTAYSEVIPITITTNSINSY